ncbi:hypothetical protein FAGAP_5025 [Fusarium agapanthi]|uniref:Uncharacterized protein n=1 Tax=Fusarium agapanthi TaxID=1803897 RepID=A0A9P5BCF2_9HYPO|nr:hypothetical protein FAGAP_5025 [Fusarium agapanthi]
MASALAFPQQQQHQQPQGLPIQSVSSSSIDNNLLSALATYVTTGSHARSTTEQEIQELASAVVAKPGGRAHLESLIQFDSCPDHQVWKNQANASGKINITKTNLTIALEVATLELKFSASGAGFYVPWSGSLNAGTLYYNEFSQLTPGNATFKLWVKGLDFYVSIYRNQVYIGNFFYPNIGFVFPPGTIDLNGTIA